MFCWNTFLFYYLLHDFCYFNRNIRYFSPPHLDSLSPISLALQVLHLRSICFYERTDINFFPHLTKNVSVYHKAVPSVLFEGQKWKSIARYHGPYSSATTALPSISTLCSVCSPCQKERHKNKCPTEPTFVPSSLSCHLLTRAVRCKFQEKPAFIMGHWWYTACLHSVVSNKTRVDTATHWEIKRSQDKSIRSKSSFILEFNQMLPGTHFIFWELHAKEPCLVCFFLTVIFKAINMFYL